MLDSTLSGKQAMAAAVALAGLCGSEEGVLDGRQGRRSKEWWWERSGMRNALSEPQLH